MQIILKCILRSHDFCSDVFPHYKYSLPHIQGLKNVHFDAHQRCNGQYWTEKGVDNIHQPLFVCPANRVKVLVEDVVKVMSPFLGLRETAVEVRYLDRASMVAGCVGHYNKTININPFRVINPMDAIATTLHELAHLKLNDLNHYFCKSHCLAWKECVQTYTHLFTVSIIVLLISITYQLAYEWNLCFESVCAMSFYFILLPYLFLLYFRMLILRSHIMLNECVRIRFRYVADPFTC